MQCLKFSFLAVQGAKSDVKKQAAMSPSLAKQVLQMLGLIEALEMQFKSGYTWLYMSLLLYSDFMVNTGRLFQFLTGHWWTWKQHWHLYLCWLPPHSMSMHVVFKTCWRSRKIPEWAFLKDVNMHRLISTWNQVVDLLRDILYVMWKQCTFWMCDLDRTLIESHAMLSSYYS